MPAHKATVVALIVNELATNAIKHGFHNRASGTVTVIPQPGRNLCVSVEMMACRYRPLSTTSSPRGSASIWYAGSSISSAVSCS